MTIKTNINIINSRIKDLNTYMEAELSLPKPKQDRYRIKQIQNSLNIAQATVKNLKLRCI